MNNREEMLHDRCGQPMFHQLEGYWRCDTCKVTVLVTGLCDLIQVEISKLEAVQVHIKHIQAVMSAYAKGGARAG